MHTLIGHPRHRLHHHRHRDDCYDDDYDYYDDLSSLEVAVVVVVLLMVPLVRIVLVLIVVHVLVVDHLIYLDVHYSCTLLVFFVDRTHQTHHQNLLSPYTLQRPCRYIHHRILKKKINVCFK